VIWSWAAPYAIAAAQQNDLQIFNHRSFYCAIPKPKPIASTYVSGFLVYQDLVFCPCRIEA